MVRSLDFCLQDLLYSSRRPLMNDFTDGYIRIALLLLFFGTHLRSVPVERDRRDCRWIKSEFHIEHSYLSPNKCTQGMHVRKLIAWTSTNLANRVTVLDSHSRKSSSIKTEKEAQSLQLDHRNQLLRPCINRVDYMTSYRRFLQSAANLPPLFFKVSFQVVMRTQGSDTRMLTLTLWWERNLTCQLRNCGHS